MLGWYAMNRLQKARKAMLHFRHLIKDYERNELTRSGENRAEVIEVFDKALCCTEPVDTDRLIYLDQPRQKEIEETKRGWEALRSLFEEDAGLSPEDLDAEPYFAPVEAIYYIANLHCDEHTRAKVNDAFEAADRFYLLIGVLLSNDYLMGDMTRNAKVIKDSTRAIYDTCDMVYMPNMHDIPFTMLDALAAHSGPCEDIRAYFQKRKRKGIGNAEGPDASLGKRQKRAE